MDSDATLPDITKHHIREGKTISDGTIASLGAFLLLRLINTFTGTMIALIIKSKLTLHNKV